MGRLRERLQAVCRRLAVPTGVIAGLAVFALWMSIVGTPHVVETLLGVLIATIAGTLVAMRMRRPQSRRDRSRASAVI